MEEKDNLSYSNDMVKRVALLFITVNLFLAGCSAVGVPLTWDPAKKLRYADALYNEYDRPLPAESLIAEAKEICEKKYKDDDTCLAAVYMEYAGFLQSPSVGNWLAHYQKYGFSDKTVTVDNRYEKSIEYWLMATRIFEKYSMYGELCNAYLNIGKLYQEVLKDNQEACKSFEKSLESYRRYKNGYPDGEIVLPWGDEGFVEYVNSLELECGCS